MPIYHRPLPAKFTLLEFGWGPNKIEDNQEIHAHHSQQPNETHQKSKVTYHREATAWNCLRVCMHETNSINLELSMESAPRQITHDLHEALRCSPNDNSLQVTRETYHHCDFSDYIQVKILCWCGGWPPKIPIQAQGGNFWSPRTTKRTPKTANTTQFGPSIHLNLRRMLSDLGVGTYRPNGNLTIVNLAKDGIPVAILILRWSSWRDSGGSAFSCCLARMQWVANKTSKIDTYTSTL